jgi:hypothetical protein
MERMTRDQMVNEFGEPGVENPMLLDLIGVDPATDKVVLTMIERRAWGAEPRQFQQIEEKITEMEESLPPQVRSRYTRVAAKHPRMIVPVIRGVCYGCFVSVPTALASDADRNAELRSCQNCGRFLYLID